MADQTDEKLIKDYYNDWYSREGAGTMRPAWAYRRFVETLEPVAGKRLLDIACGTGFLLKTATEMGLETAGVDISEEAVKVARGSSPTSDVRVSGAEELPFADGSFDYVTCLGSIEHFLDPDRALQEMKRVTGPAGRFCLVVPNSRYWAYKLKGEEGTGQQAVREQLRTLEEWKELFARNGFVTDRILVDDWPARDRAIRGARGANQFLKRVVFQALWRVLPMKWTYQFIFVMRKQ